MRALVFACLAGLICLPVRAADRDDIYFEAVLGSRAQSKQESKLQVGGVLGYCPTDNLGVGLGVDQSFSISKGDKASDATQYALEARWFLEPLELAGGVGWQNLQIDGGSTKTSALLLGTADYLFALTPSLAFKAEARGQLVLNETSSLFFGAGMRFIY